MFIIEREKIYFNGLKPLGIIITNSSSKIGKKKREKEMNCLSLSRYRRFERANCIALQYFSLKIISCTDRPRWMRHIVMKSRANTSLPSCLVLWIKRQAIRTLAYTSYRRDVYACSSMVPCQWYLWGIYYTKEKQAAEPERSKTAIDISTLDRA